MLLLWLVCSPLGANVHPQGVKLQPWRRGSVDVASASGPEDPGSNPARVKVLNEILSMLLCVIDFIHMHCLCLFEKYVLALVTKNVLMG
jgi:hypothetical protein